MDSGDMPLPWFLPGVAISGVVAIAAGGPVARSLGVRGSIGRLLLFSLGIILSATLTPLREAIDSSALGPATCDFSRVWPASLSDYLKSSDLAGNVLMFVPLGAAVGVLPWSRRNAVIVAAAVALPFAVEIIQLLVRPLDRACESADIVDNLMGLLVGLAAGWVAARVLPAIQRPKE